MRTARRLLPLVVLAAVSLPVDALASGASDSPDKRRLDELTARLKKLREERAGLEKELAERRATGAPTVVADLAAVLRDRGIEAPPASAARAFGGAGGSFDVLVLFKAGGSYAVAVKGGGAPADVPRERLGDRLALEAARRPGRAGTAVKVVDAPVLVGGAGAARFEDFQLVLDRGARSGFWAYGLATVGRDGKLGWLPLDLPTDTRIAPGVVSLDEVRVKLALVDGRPTVTVGRMTIPEGDDRLEEVLATARMGYKGSSPVGLPVVIDARPDVPYAAFVGALNACIRAGVKDISIAAPAPSLGEGGR